MWQYRHTFEDEQVEVLLKSVYEGVAFGGTVNSSIKGFADHNGRTERDVRSLYKELLNEDPNVRKALEDATVQCIGMIMQSEDDVDDKVVQITASVDMLWNPTGAVQLPPNVAEDIREEIASQGNTDLLYSVAYMKTKEFIYDNSLEYIEEKPSNARKFYLALDHGYEIEPNMDDILGTIYRAFERNESDDPQLAETKKLMQSMMILTMRTLGNEPKFLMNTSDDIPF